MSADIIERVRDELVERLDASILDRRLEEVAPRAGAPFLRAKTDFSDLPSGLRAASLEVNASDGRLDAALAVALTRSRAARATRRHGKRARARKACVLLRYLELGRRTTYTSER